MIRRLFRWAFYAAIFAIVLIVAGILLFDTFARSMVENRIRRETGLETKIGAVHTRLGSASIAIEGLKLYLPAQFGGSLFIDAPEIYLEIDRAALQRERLRFRLVRIHLARIHVVEDKQGRNNLQTLTSRSKISPAESHWAGFGSGPRPEFERIDMLNLTLGRAQFTSLKNPEKNRETDLATRDAIFQNVEAKDLESIIVAISLKRNAEFIVEGLWSNPVGMPGRGSGRTAKKVLESAASPVTRTAK